MINIYTLTFQPWQFRLQLKLLKLLNECLYGLGWFRRFPEIGMKSLYPAQIAKTEAWPGSPWPHPEGYEVDMTWLWNIDTCYDQISTLGAAEGENKVRALLKVSLDSPPLQSHGKIILQPAQNLSPTPQAFLPGLGVRASPWAVSSLKAMTLIKLTVDAQ